MRKTLPIAFCLLFLCGCAPLQKALEDMSRTSSSSSSPMTTSGSVFPSYSIELPMEESPSSAATGTGSLAERIVDHGILEIGDEHAPQTLTIFTNVSCRYCAQFVHEQLPSVTAEFIATGDVKLQWVITPFKKYPNSSLEASALLCATALHHGQAMFAALTDAKSRDRTSIFTMAKKIGLSQKEFTACLSSKETKKLLTEQQELIHRQNVTLIPAFVMNDQTQVGLPVLSDLRKWMDQAINR